MVKAHTRNTICHMPKNIVIFADGTGQAGGIPGAIPTNVYKLYKACPQVGGTQITFYDPGVGSQTHGRQSRRRRIYNFVARATGLGLSKNIADCYDAIIRHYEPGDRIFLFGFSRGAYTVRSLGGLLGLCGVPAVSPRGHDLRTNKRARKRAVRRAVRWVYQCYGRSELKRRMRQHRGEKFRNRYLAQDAIPYFIGVWDTVRALGVPGINWLIFWRHAFHDSSLNPKVPYGRHAIAIDENRSIFAPELWDEGLNVADPDRIKQVWFPGVHTDIGGGYSESELSDLTLEWMLAEATAIPHPLHVDLKALALKPSHRGVQHDERLGWGVLWRKGTRDRLRLNRLDCETNVTRRIKEPKVPTMRGEMPYRPVLLAAHPEFAEYYQALRAQRRSLIERLGNSFARK